MTSQPPDASSNKQQSTHQPASPANQPSAQQAGQARRRAWSDVVEEILAESMARGDFENLPGKGKPLRLEDDHFAGDKALAYRLLKNNDAAPPEIERSREIDADLARAEELLVTLRRRRDTLLGRISGSSAAERRMYNVLRDKTETQFREALRAINSRVLSLNILAPAALHRPTIAVEARLRDFAEEFPRLAE